MTMLQDDKNIYELFLIELWIERQRVVEFYPCLYELNQALIKEAGKHGNSVRLEYIFKITGEDKLVLVVKVLEINLIENLMHAVGEALRGGTTFSVSCTPLRSYESFAEGILGYDLKSHDSQEALGRGNLFWWEFNIDFEGPAYEKFISNWKEEAIAMLKLKSSVEVSMEIYKVVSERKVHCFINSSSQEELDLLTFQLPIMKSTGDRTQLFCKSIQHFSDFLSENKIAKIGPFRKFLHWCHHQKSC